MMHPKRNTHLTTHHILAKSRGGTKHPSNSLRIWRDKHNEWHVLHHNDTIDDIISKLNQHPCKFLQSVLYDKRRYQAYAMLWRNQPVEHIIAVLKRVRRFKKKLKGA